MQRISLERTIEFYADQYAKNAIKRKVNPKTKREYIKDHPKPMIGERFTCPICKKTITHEHKNEICLDHDHKTGKIRGWICGSCNSSIGKFNEDVEILERAIRWLKGNLN